MYLILNDVVLLFNYTMVNPYALIHFHRFSLWSWFYTHFCDDNQGIRTVFR